MKKSFKLIALSLFGIILFGACGNKEEKSINQVATNYLNAMFKDLDPVKAKTFATPESASFLDMIQQIQEMGGNMEDARKKSKDVTIKIGKAEIKDDMAMLPYTLTSPESEEPTEEVLQLKKIDGKWLVHQTKETSAPEGDVLEVPEEDIVAIEEEIIVEETK